MKTIEIEISSFPIQPEHLTSFVSDETCGGIATFVGTARKFTQTREVLKLDFEAYEPMAIKEMTKIAHEIQKRWPVKKIAIHHRIGTVALKEIAVVIAVSSPHRKDAFEACEFAIDSLKRTVPIWKKEFFKDGAIWVAAHP